MQLTSKDYRNIAWQALSGNWGFIIGATLLASLICGAVTSIPTVGPLASIAITGPISYGLVIITINVIRKEFLKLSSLFDGFSNFGETFLLYLLNSIFVALWTLLFIIPGIIKSFAYSMSPYILADNPNMTQKEARKQSERLMNGNKFRLFCLELSFIGWIFLSILTCGILLIWVIPYMQTAVAAFYDDLIQHNDINTYVNSNNNDNSFLNNTYENSNNDDNSVLNNTY